MTTTIYNIDSLSWYGVGYLFLDTSLIVITNYFDEFSDVLSKLKENGCAIQNY
jgi:hypothetical protein